MLHLPIRPRHRTPFTPGRRTFLSKVIAPAALVFGVLLVVFLHFNGVVKATRITKDQFHGDIAFSQGGFAYRFLENAWVDRPALSYDAQDLISYSEWNSTVSVNGKVLGLWNNLHSYNYDTTKRQIHSRAIGSDNVWRLIEVVRLLNSNTVTVKFDFEANPSSPGSVHYVFDIAHATSSSYEWYNYHTGKGTFTAQVISQQGISATGRNSARGTLTLTAAGNAVPTPAIIMRGTTSIVSRTGSVGLANAFFTQYTVTNPPPGMIILLGTETLTFQPEPTTPGAPFPVPGQ